MRTLFLALILAAGLAGCAHTPSQGMTQAAPPNYVMAQADGSCWADDFLYAPCAWTFEGGQSGYHWYWEGKYYHDNRSWSGTNHPPADWIAAPAAARETPWPRYTPTD